MRRVTTWWRDLGGLLAACVLALLVVAPTTSLAACLCAEDGIAQVSAVQSVGADQHEDSAPCKAACCVGGHCHHGGSLLDAPVVTVAAPVRAVAEHPVTPARALASRALSTLERPPRG